MRSRFFCWIAILANIFSIALGSPKEEASLVEDFKILKLKWNMILAQKGFSDQKIEDILKLHNLSFDAPESSQSHFSKEALDDLLFLTDLMEHDPYNLAQDPSLIPFIHKLGGGEKLYSLYEELQKEARKHSLEVQTVLSDSQFPSCFVGLMYCGNFSNKEDMLQVCLSISHFQGPLRQIQG